MKPSRKVWVPLVVVAAGAFVVLLVWLTRPQVEARPATAIRPLVRTLTVTSQDMQYSVFANGSVVPRRQSDLVPQVSGEVTWVSPSLVPGGFFAANEPLARIDSRDYAAALESSRAAVARTESELSRARTERQRQRELAERSVASQARIDDAENAYRIAEALRREALAALERAERDFERTELRASFEGRVREESVDVGQFVNRGTPIAKIYAVDFAEVRLPVPDRELRYLDLSLGSRPRSSDENGEIPEPNTPEVILRAEFAGRKQEWRGQIVRTEGEIDPRSRMVNIVARVKDPYASDPPLAVGLFVSAEILGRRIQGAYVIPRSAVREDADGTHVLVVDGEDRIRIRAVKVLRRQRDSAVIGAGLVGGERVCVSPLASAIDGMLVRVVEAAPEEVSGATL